jgi:hypothetical protein
MLSVNAPKAQTSFFPKSPAKQEILYELYAARLDGGNPLPNLGAWCGIEYAMSAVRGNLNGGAHAPQGMRLYPAELTTDGGVLRMRTSIANFSVGVQYTLNVVAVYKVNGTSYRAIYTPTAWNAGTHVGHGGWSAGGTFFFLVFMAMLLGLIVWFFRRWRSGKPLADMDCARDLKDDTVWLVLTTKDVLVDYAGRAWECVQPRAADLWDRATGGVSTPRARVGASSGTSTSGPLSAPMLADPGTMPLQMAAGSRRYAGLEEEAIAVPVAMESAAEPLPVVTTMPLGALPLGADPFAAPVGVADPFAAAEEITTQPLGALPPAGVRSDLNDMDD